MHKSKREFTNTLFIEYPHTDRVFGIFHVIYEKYEVKKSENAGLIHEMLVFLSLFLCGCRLRENIPQRENKASGPVLKRYSDRESKNVSWIESFGWNVCISAAVSAFKIDSTITTSIGYCIEPVIFE